MGPIRVIRSGSWRSAAFSRRRGIRTLFEAVARDAGRGPAHRGRATGRSQAALRARVRGARPRRAGSDVGGPARSAQRFARSTGRAISSLLASEVAPDGGPRRPAERRRRGAFPGSAGGRHARRGDRRAGGRRAPRPARSRRVTPGALAAAIESSRAIPTSASRMGAAGIRRVAVRLEPRRPAPTGSTACSARLLPTAAARRRRARWRRACRRDAARLLHAGQAPVPDGAFRAIARSGVC